MQVAVLKAQHCPEACSGVQQQEPPAQPAILAATMLAAEHNAEAPADSAKEVQDVIKGSWCIQ